MFIGTRKCRNRDTPNEKTGLFGRTLELTQTQQTLGMWWDSVPMPLLPRTPDFPPSVELGGRHPVAGVVAFVEA